MFAVIVANEQGFLFCRQWSLEVPSLIMSADEQRWSPYLPVLMSNDICRVESVAVERSPETRLSIVGKAHCHAQREESR